MILQQLTAGINAHINFDLAIAATETSPGAQLPQLKPDFDQINAVLAEQVGSVETEMAEVSPLIGDLETIGLRSETGIINFDLVKARDASWCAAERLAAEPSFPNAMTIDGLDLTVFMLGRAILYPPLLSAALLPIRAAESNDVRHVIEVLAQMPAGQKCMPPPQISTSPVT